jgi:hypothetical protein
MKQVAVITEEYAQQVKGVMYAPSSFCHPVQDGIGRWVISLEEMDALGLDCEVVDWVAPPDDLNEL